MSNDTLFPRGEPSDVSASTNEGPPRLRYPVRDQVEFREVALDSLLPSDHRARVVWNFAARQDFSDVYATIEARGSAPGRAANDPRVLLALWLYATLEGIGSARYLAQRCEDDVVYRWICGGLSMNYHTLSDFRVAHEEWLDSVLTRNIAALLDAGLVTMNRVAQDGMRVRASAGASSYRRRSSLEGSLEQARQQVEALRKELDEGTTQSGARSQAAQLRAARERQERLERAWAVAADLEKKHRSAESAPEGPDDKEKNGGKPKPPRVSSTDPDVPIMKMADGGFRPAVNVQIATDTATQLITGIDAVYSGSDLGQAVPMVEQHESRYGKKPSELLVDGGFAKKEAIEQLASSPYQCTVYAPVQKPKKADQDRYAPRQGDGEGVAQWRKRMATPEAQEIYKERASTAECVNALARMRGLYQMPVRGLKKIKCVVLLYALAHNLMRAHQTEATLPV